MAKSFRQRISENRRLYQNQYAFLDDTDSYSALIDGETVNAPSADKIAASRRILQDPYAHLDEFGGFSAIATENTACLQPDAFTTLSQQAEGKYFALLRNKRGNHRYSNAEIESKAKDLQRKMWQDRGEMWPVTAPSNPIDILDPAIAFGLIGYDFDLEETLGQDYHEGKQIEVAGIIDDTSKKVRISRQFPYDVRSFTAAHELGHALLHDARGLHRDRPLDGTSVSREAVEREADKFASYFLMPGKLLKVRFEAHFGTNNFSLNDDTRFALTRGTSLNLKKDCKTLRDLSRILASAMSYNGLHFVSLASQFKVSTEAMAIRLEELGLAIF